VIEPCDTSALRPRINSLGLFDDRLRSLSAITAAFLAGADQFEVALAPPHKIHGVGQFGVHSFLIFARDGGAVLRPVDAALVTFCNWRRKHAANAIAREADEEKIAAEASG
jgi:methyl-CpG-binding domain protein 4